MTRIARRPTSIHNGMCEHGCCDWCPQGCFDDQSAQETFEEFQRRLKAREYCIGWHPVDSQKKTYYEALYDSWHEAEAAAASLRVDTSYVFFVEAATITKKCPRCNGTGIDLSGDTGINSECGHCHGKGRVRS